MQILRHLVVGTDFSECSEHALDAAITLSKLALARITVVHVCELTSEQDDDLLRRCQERLAALCASRWNAGVVLTPVLRTGRPWEKIHNVAAEVGAQLIVIGRHGAERSGTDLGSVATGVLRSASRPVLTVGLDFARTTTSTTSGPL